MSSARPEGPRPDFRRRHDHNTLIVLDGTWDVAFDDADEGIANGWYISSSWQKRGVEMEEGPETILLPFAHQTEDSGIDDSRAHEIIWYGSGDMYRFPRHEDTHECQLQFGAVDYEATVWINGSQVGHHVGGHVGFSVPFKLSPEYKTIDIVVRAKDRPHDLTQPRGKQYWKPEPESIFYYPTTGIWQSVWLEVVPLTRIERTVLVPDIDAGTLSIDFELLGLARVPGATVKAVVSLFGTEISSSTAHVSRETESAKIVATVRVPGMLAPEALRAQLQKQDVMPPEMERMAWVDGLALWSPETPTLYDVELSLLDADGKELDNVQTYAGMRKVSVNEKGLFCLNNKPYFQSLVLNQGYWPSSGMTAPTETAFEEDIKMMKQIGFNGCRLHQKVEDKRFLCAADRLGFLVWGEMANAYEFSAQYCARIMAEWTEVVRRDQSHPCIVAWTPINESWGVPALASSEAQRNHVLALYHHIKSLDPTRLVVDNDGWEHVKTDLTTFHDYGNAEHLRGVCASEERILAPKAGRDMFVGDGKHDPKTPFILSEFGGISFAGSGGKGAWGYQAAESEEDYLARLAPMTEAILAGGLVQGWVYTQLSDIETEQNGLLTKDRRFKVDPAKLRAIFGRRPAA